MDNGQYRRPEFTTATTSHRFPPTISSPLPELPFDIHQAVLNPNAAPPMIFSPPPPLPPPSAAQDFYGGRLGWNDLYGGDGGGINLNHTDAASTSVKWLRQETLSLLDIRSRLDPCFKQVTSSNHKAPLWDEVSRIMKEEYGFERSGRKCKEKFDNLYKYYKKTKEGKVGKQDGKHYRFFRQLEAIFGHKSSHPSPPSKPFDDPRRIPDADEDGLIATAEELIEFQIAKLMNSQDAWCEKILHAIERNEQDQIVRENERRRRESARLDHEYEVWTDRVARVESRDRVLLETLQDFVRVKSMEVSNEDWVESEISNLIRIQTRLGENSKFEEVAFQMSRLGYDRNERDCKAAWEKIRVAEVCTKTRNDVAKNDVSSDGCFNAMMNLGF